MKAAPPCGLRLVLPCADKLFFVSIEGDKDTALAFRVSRGYFACPSLSLLKAFLSYLDKHTDRVVAVGQLETVVSADGVKDYRQRVVFSDIALLAKLCLRFRIVTVIPKSFQIGVSQLSDCSGVVPYLTEYVKEFHNGYSVEEWLTHSCIFQLRVLFGGSDKLFVASESSADLLEGLLNRSPYLCPIYNEDHPEASTLICISPKLIYQGKRVLTASTGVKLKLSEAVQSLLGYTAKNLAEDMKMKKKVIRA